MNTRIASCVLALAALFAAAAAHAQTPGRITRESTDSHGDESVGQAGRAAVSADGRFVAFQSDGSDLVPGDTNKSTDVFVRDRSSGVLQRVSLSWNGMEARGDSMCPALSANGRFVAFASRAWNMYPGGANLGHPRWDIYVHDRQAGSTERVSLSASGGDPNGDSECPAISGDGQRVAFASAATNLDGSKDDDELDVFVRDLTSSATIRITGPTRGAGAVKYEHPVISADGRFVAFEGGALDRVATAPGGSDASTTTRIYVRDLEHETTEVVSVGAGASATRVNGDSSFPSISADGRLVAFRSRATNLVASLSPVDRLGRIFVRDRAAGRTWVASPIDPRERDCGRDGEAFPCSPGAQGPPSLSADGRFVAFSSRSLQHLPANQSHGDQIYLFDNVGRRLRRLSVDPTGVPGTACSWSPALSGDGYVLAYASKSMNLAPGATVPEPGAAPDVDVYSQAWTCDDRRCGVVASCPAEPSASCESATSSLLRLRKHPPGGTHGDELFWRWSGMPAATPFPDPAGPGLYQLCVYADTLALDVAASEGPACAGATGPCWQSIASGYRLRDPAGGITSLTVAGGARSRRVLLRGRGPLLDAPYLPVAGGRGIAVQLQDTETGRCWGAEFPATAITRNIAGGAGTGSTHDGWLVAEMR